MEMQRTNALDRQRDKLVPRSPSWCIRTRSESRRKGHGRRCVKKASITRGLAAVLILVWEPLSVSMITVDLRETGVEQGDKCRQPPWQGLQELTRSPPWWESYLQGLTVTVRHKTTKQQFQLGLS